MFDIGFTELLIIGVVALVVIGPERLPKVARTAGQWLGRLNRYVSQVKQDIDRDMRLEELRKMQQDMKDSAQKYEIMANETVHRVEDTVAEETGQISKVMQAMSSTDGGLTMQEYDKLRAQEAAAGPVQPAEALSGQEEPAVAAQAATELAETGAKSGQDHAQDKAQA
jgi:sec-independent protein translocase protein TatB